MKELAPSSAIPLAYYVVAHAGLALALLVLAVDPALPGASFYQPRMVALVHLVTIPWLSGSILGSFYIVGPLALRVPMAAGKGDWIAFSSFVLGTTGMVGHFWINTYDGMAWSAGLVSGAIAWVAVRAWRGLPGSPAPWPVSLHVALAFFNILAAAALGILIGFDRTRGFLGLSPLAAMFAHAHIAAVGWVTMMVVGLSYRLIPMILPAAMPTGRQLALSAVLIETGLAVLVVALLAWPAIVPIGALLIVGGLGAFVSRIRRIVKRRLPRPPALPLRDWSTWQTHVAFLWLLIAAVLGVGLSFGIGGASTLTLMWVYGVAGLVGFLAQIVTGMQGRLVPFYAWYRAFDARNGPPAVAANALPAPRFARPILVLWAAGVPLLAFGLPAESHVAIRLAALSLLGGVVLGLAYINHMLRAANPKTQGSDLEF
ncbi:MAG TPA: hypothetical protein VGD94_09365 [Vicinamibacterales bacterium]